jgi:hypothetical protein
MPGGFLEPITIATAMTVQLGSCHESGEQNEDQGQRHNMSRRMIVNLLSLFAMLAVMVPWQRQPLASHCGQGDWQNRYIVNESVALNAVSDLAIRNGPILRLKIADFWIELEDVLACDHQEEECLKRGIQTTCDHDDGICRAHTFMRHEAAAGAFLVLLRFWEGSTVFWINDKTGQITDINGEPQFSPDGAYFAIVQTPDVYDFSGIQVWRTKGPALQTEYLSFDPGLQIYLNFIRWLDNDSFLMITHWNTTDWRKEDYNSIQTSGTTSMVRRGSDWVPARPPEIYAVPMRCSADYTQQQSASDAFLPLTLPDGQVCVEDRTRTRQETEVRNCVFSAAAMPCENIEIRRAR